MTKKTDDVFTMPLTTLDKSIAATLAAIEKVDSELPGLIALTAEERKSSQGRFRAGEANALLGVLDAAQARPELFASLSDRDFGQDPDSFEVDLLRDRLQRVAKLGKIAEALDALNARIADSVLHLSDETRPVMLDAYAIAKSVAKTDAKLRSQIAGAVDFFGKIGQAAAETRRKKKTAK
jgi:hypothetical protein